MINKNNLKEFEKDLLKIFKICSSFKIQPENKLVNYILPYIIIRDILETEKEIKKKYIKSKKMLFSRWNLKKAGIIHITNGTFINISQQAKSTIDKLEKENFLIKITDEDFPNLNIYKLTKVGENIISANNQILDKFFLCSECENPLKFDLDLKETIEDKIGQHVSLVECCENKSCNKTEMKKNYIRQLTPEQNRLLFLIYNYSTKNKWISHTSLRTFIFEGIWSYKKKQSAKKIFKSWEYAPMSVSLILGRRYLNISQEGEDDLNDLREIGLIDELRMSSIKHQYVTNYTINTEGLILINLLSEEDKNAIINLITCPTCNKSKLMINAGIENLEAIEDECILFCPKCEYKKTSMITTMEKISYKSIPLIYGMKKYDY